MSSIKHLCFNSALGQQKPKTIMERQTACPFCQRSELQGILAEEGSMILLKNKYPVLQDTLQTVLIETDDCNGELSTYPKEHLHKLIRFGVTKWLEMEESGEYASVLFFRNYGPHSGGTVHHPHMQIVGLKHVDYSENINPQDFKGIIIEQKNTVEFNISTLPRIGFYELNIILEDLRQLDTLADYLQVAAHYLLNNFNKNCNSYNVFFYHLGNQIMAKVMPRFPTSPLFVGYSIPQVANRITEVAEDIRSQYLQA